MVVPQGPCPLGAWVSYLTGLVMAAPGSTVPGTHEGSKRLPLPPPLLLPQLQLPSYQLQDSLQL